MMEEMNDVNDFMAKFGDNFEIKWGLSIDPELGEKVKVTILATGFGIDNIDNSRKIQTTIAHDIDVRNQKAEKEAEDLNRRRRYYRDGERNIKYRHRPNIFIFNNEDLEKDDIILEVENIPTYCRSRQKLQEIRNLANDGDFNEDERNRNKENKEPVQGTISFTEENN